MQLKTIDHGFQLVEDGHIYLTHTVENPVFLSGQAVKISKFIVETLR